MSAPPPHVLRSDAAYPRLKEHLIGATGLAYYADKDDELAARVGQRLAALGLRGCGAYLALLMDGAPGAVELDALIENLTIGETFFFRHREMFDALREVVLPDVLARNRATRRLRVWSAGCSIGAEAYSIAILLRREFARELAGWDVTIVGTDINRDFLARARQGRYEDWALRNTPEAERRAYCVPDGRAWSVAPAFREGVSFQYHNLVAHPFPSLCNDLFAFDLILCRNVTIYFDAPIVSRVVGQLHESLAEGGWLSVGHAEPNTELFCAFHVVNACGAILYQKGPTRADPHAWSAPVVESEFLRLAPEPVVPVATVPAAAVLATAWVPPYLPELVDPFAGQGLPAKAAAGAAPPVADLTAIRALADRGEWDEADRRCRDAQQRDRLNPGVYFVHALVLEQTGHHADAERALRQAIYLDRRFVLAHYYLGLLLQKQAHFGAAARAFENALQLAEKLDSVQVFAEGDGLTAGAVAQLTRMHLEALEKT